MTGLPIPPMTPITAFDQLMEALAQMASLDGEILVSSGNNADLLGQFDQQADRAVEAHRWLVEHGDALTDLRDVLSFIYGEVEG